MLTAKAKGSVAEGGFGAGAVTVTDTFEPDDEPNDVSLKGSSPKGSALLKPSDLNGSPVII